MATIGSNTMDSLPSEYINADQLTDSQIETLIRQWNSHWALDSLDARQHEVLENYRSCLRCHLHWYLHTVIAKRWFNVAEYYLNFTTIDPSRDGNCVLNELLCFLEPDSTASSALPEIELEKIKILIQKVIWHDRFDAAEDPMHANSERILAGWILQRAATAHSLDVIRKIHEKRPEKIHTVWKDMMNSAAHYGYMDISTWLFETCPDAIRDVRESSCIAARYGHLDILQLFVNQGMPLDRQALLWAFIFRHSNIVNFLILSIPDWPPVMAVSDEVVGACGVLKARAADLPPRTAFDFNSKWGKKVMSAFELNPIGIAQCRI